MKRSCARGMREGLGACVEYERRGPLGEEVNAGAGSNTCGSVLYRGVFAEVCINTS